MLYFLADRLCGLVVTVPGYKSTGSGSFPEATRFSEMWWSVALSSGFVQNCLQFLCRIHGEIAYTTPNKRT
jgi:hypothetical protein